MSEGPDQLLPAEELVTTRPDGAVRIRDQNSFEDVPPMSVPSLLRQASERFGPRLALAVKRDGVWQQWSYGEYYAESHVVAKAMLALGLRPFFSVAIIGFNAPEWLMAQNGAVLAGGFSVGVYATNSADACKYILLDCRAEIVVVENEAQLAKIRAIHGALSHLKAVVQYTGRPDVSGFDAGIEVVSWQELLDKGRKFENGNDQLAQRLKNIAVNQCCSIVYTSGTTGPPKGVMLSHDNITWTARISDTFVGITGEDSFISYLPLSHSAAQMIDVWMPMAVGASVHFADKNALKGSLVDTLREVRPTVFFAVPRVYEKMFEKMAEVSKTVKGLKRTMAEWSKKKGLAHHMRDWQPSSEKTEMEGGDIGYKVAKKLVFSKVKTNLGLDRCRVASVGAAPFNKEMFDYFLSLDLPIYECYGMSETSGPQTGNTPRVHRYGSVGSSLVGCQTRIDNPDSEGKGEILMWGRNIMMGYLGNEATHEAIDSEGWLHSGDIGCEIGDGHFKVTGRIKELIITAGGENVPPVLVEELIKNELASIVSNVMVIGDRKKFLSCLLTLSVQVDPDTLEPSEQLTTKALQFCKDFESDATTVGEAKVCPKVRKAIEQGVKRANEKATSNAQRVQKWEVVEKDFSVPGGELGPTLKLKRHVVAQKYETQIRNFYSSG